MSKFFKGALLGAGIGAGLTWLTVTKKGRAVRDEMLDHAAVVYEQVKDKLLESDAWRKMEKSEFVAVVRDIVDRYAMKSGIAMELKEMIVKLISTQWKNLQDQLVEEKPKKKKK
jgi:gas vesicle protein